MKHRFQQTITTCLGIGFSLLFGVLFADFSWTNKLELKLQDSLIRFRSATIPASEDIVLLAIEREFLSDQRIFNHIGIEREIDSHNDYLIYAELTEWLLENEAGLIVLNFPHDWAQNHQHHQVSSDSNKPQDFITQIRNLINKNNNHERIVFVSPTVRISNPYHRNIQDYIQFLFSGNDWLEYSPEEISTSLGEIQGFFEYETLEAREPIDLSSPARTFYSQGHFDKEIQLKNFAWLSWEKYQNNLQEENNYSTAKIPLSVRSNYWETGTFKTNFLKKLCIKNLKPKDCDLLTTTKFSSNIRNKVIIVGFTTGTELDALEMKSPFGKMISGIEVQANFLSSLMTNSYYQTIPKEIKIIIYIFGGITISSIMIFCNTRQCIQYLSLGIFGGYGGLGLVAFGLGWTIPIIPSMLTGMATAFCLAVYLKNNQLVQENERKQITIAEEAATFSQAKKLILRVWSDIHDDSLQELKIAMYELEFSDLSDCEREPIIDRLSQVGIKIRQHLKIDLDNELFLQPELRQGLVAAIENHLQELIDSERLRLKVNLQLQAIDEPLLNSNWIDAREDIYRFFRETITNILHHAQGQKGTKTTATQVTVSLSQKGEQCTLIVENDGAVVKTAKDTKKKGGMGTKLMSEMTDSLPDGSWERVALADSGMRVKLTWQQRF